MVGSSPWSSLRTSRATVGKKGSHAQAGDETQGASCQVSACSATGLSWDVLLSAIHPIQIAILEAMAWLARPVSPVELMKMFDEPGDHYLSAISYHMRRLKQLGAVKPIRSRPVRGAQETFWSLTPKMHSKGESP